ncbi:unnamed protein product [Lampetra planeri]
MPKRDGNHQAPTDQQVIPPHQQAILEVLGTVEDQFLGRGYSPSMVTMESRKVEEDGDDSDSHPRATRLCENGGLRPRTRGCAQEGGFAPCGGRRGRNGGRPLRDRHGG